MMTVFRMSIARSRLSLTGLLQWMYVRGMILQLQ